MEDEINRDDLLREIDEVQSNIDSLRAQKAHLSIPRAMPSFFISILQAVIGLIFLGLFFMSIVFKFSPVIIAVFFLASFLGLFPFITDIFTKKEFISLRAVGVVVLTVLAGSYVLLWDWVLNPYIELVFLVLSLLFFFVLFFFIIHTYIAYIKRIASDEIKLLSVIGGVAFIFFLIQLLYSHFLLLTIYLILIGLFIKGTIDFIERFRK